MDGFADRGSRSSLPACRGRGSSHRSYYEFAPIGFAATAAGALVALGVVAIKVLTGAAVFFAHDPLVMLSAVLIQTGVMLIGLALVTDVLARTYVDREQRKEHL
jgi:hypothetical protein